MPLRLASLVTHRGMRQLTPTVLTLAMPSITTPWRSGAVRSTMGIATRKIIGWAAPCIDVAVPIPSPSAPAIILWVVVRPTAWLGMAAGLEARTPSPSTGVAIHDTRQPREARVEGEWPLR
jgi:hypothetical protein